MSLAYDKEHGCMRKVDIVRRMAEDTECTTVQAAEAVEAILATVLGSDEARYLAVRFLIAPV